MNLRRFAVRALFAAALLLPPLSLSAQQASGPADSQKSLPAAVKDAELGKTPNVHRCGDLFLAGQFEPGDIETLKQQKIARVLSLRTEGEVDWDEAGLLDLAGIEFKTIPFRSPETLTDEVFDNVRKVLREDDGKTLFHCGSANRVGGVWLTYRVLDQGVEMEQALKEAKQIGLRAPWIEEKAIDYIQRQQQKQTDRDPAAAKPASVNPGINTTFLDPELNVDQFVERFEMESREIYVAREEILSATGIQSGDTVADVGAGTGLFTRLFANRVGNDGWVFAVEIAPRFVEHINREAKAHNLPNITSVLCADNSVCLPPESVDVVFVCDTYHHFEYPQSTLASIHRALREGGKLVVVDFERIPGKSREWLLDHVRAGKEVVRAEIQDAGFTLVEEKRLAGLKENYFLMFRK